MALPREGRAASPVRCAWKPRCLETYRRLYCRASSSGRTAPASPSCSRRCRWRSWRPSRPSRSPRAPFAAPASSRPWCNFAGATSCRRAWRLWRGSLRWAHRLASSRSRSSQPSLTRTTTLASCSLAALPVLWSASTPPRPAWPSRGSSTARRSRRTTAWRACGRSAPSPPMRRRGLEPRCCARTRRSWRASARPRPWARIGRTSARSS
mmetsp:Transcript_32173/g.92635  ORF Transcript_32173/g.92635 Transcript_32173/m.92635 type:complete len:209 (-) Transcript_32173:791-1417(-)